VKEGRFENTHYVFDKELECAEMGGFEVFLELC
jgi:hypothetical protein